MKKRFKHLSLVFALTLLCLTLLTGCFSLGSQGEENNDIDCYGTVMRNGEQINIYVSHDQRKVNLYYNDEDQKLFDTAELPTDELYDKDWCIGKIIFDDLNNDNNSDLQVYLTHSDMTESHIVWYWVEDEGYVYQADYSDFYKPIVIYDPPGDAVYYDYSMYEGLWQSDEDNMYADAYIQFDANGNWKLSSGGEEIDNGYLRYDAEENLTYVYSIPGGAIDGGNIQMDGDQLYITTCGYFNYLDGRGGQWKGNSGGNRDDENRVDFSIYEGLWQSDEVNLYPDAYLQFDAEGNWKLYSNGETIDEGYLKYDSDEDEIYAYSKRGGAIDGGIISMEGDQLNISTCGYFNYLDGRGGQWQGDSGGN